MANAKGLPRYLYSPSFRQAGFSETRMAPVLMAYPPRPGRSGFSLRPASVMAMLRGCGAGSSHLQLPFSFPAPREAGECPLVSPASFREHRRQRLRAGAAGGGKSKKRFHQATRRGVGGDLPPPLVSS
jgi:hypothetical protein